MNPPILEQAAPRARRPSKPLPRPTDLELRLRVVAHLLVERSRRSGLQSYRRCGAAPTADVTSSAELAAELRSLERELLLGASEPERWRSSEADVIAWLRRFARLRDQLARSPELAPLTPIADACLAALA